MVELTKIPPRYNTARLYGNCDMYESMSGKQYALTLSRAFADSGFIVERSANRYALYLCGEKFGVGKTWLATAVLKEMIRKRFGAPKDEEITRSNPPIWIKFHALVREVQACYNPAAKTDTLSVIRRFQNAPLLLIDDIGDIEARGETEDRRRILYEIIDHRNDHMLPAILTSNLDPDRMEEHYGGRSMQRIIELCAFAEMTGDNLREAA